ncbi:MAG: Trk system potassium transporter TrkA [Ruminococcus sp.]|nr:Trk system potassium transporter TrkA [Ruminococcus sp.]
MNIVIVGCGRVGRSIAEQLNTESHSITVIDENYKALEKIADSQNIMAIQGNGATYAVLQEADIESCDLLIAVTAADELNLYTCLLAKNAGVPSTIARVRNPEYINDVEVIKEDLKLTMAINPEYTCANEIARLVKFPGAIKISSFAKGMIDFIKIRLNEDTPISGKRVADCGAHLKGSVRIVFVERNGEFYIPNGDFELRAGDMVSFVAPSGAAAKLLKSLGTISNKGRSVMILGGSKIGYYLAKTLRETGLSVKIVEKNPERCEELSEDLDGVMIINADAMDEDLLLSEHIDRVDGVVCLMNTDEENMLASLFAKKVNPNAKVVTELGNLKFTSVTESLPLDSIIRPKQLTGEYIVRYVRGMQNTVGNNVETMYKVNGGLAEALEFIVREKSAVTSVELSRLNMKNDLQIVGINRGGKFITPGGNDTIEVGDRVIVVTKHKGLSDLRDILK